MTPKNSPKTIPGSPPAWEPPPIADFEQIPKGDMPGDKVHINDQAVAKAQAVFPVLREELSPLIDGRRRAVVAVHGGSGVGKSEIGSLLAYYLNSQGTGAYILSGDNYPHRIPQDNDHERLLVFRERGVKGLVKAGEFTKERNQVLVQLQAEARDADPELRGPHPWLAVYQDAGRRGLEAYLGSPQEIDFDEVNRIVEQFKAGAPSLLLKRMGRTASELWYDSVDLSAVQVLVIEWTHGNSDYLSGVDVPILLDSTPQETLEHRRLRNRDGAVDSPFTTMVLEIEQGLLARQAPKAKLIVAKNGQITRQGGHR